MIFFVNYRIIITITSYIFSNVILMKMQRKRLKVKRIGAKLSSFVDSVMKKMCFHEIFFCEIEKMY